MLRAFSLVLLLFFPRSLVVYGTSNESLSQQDITQLLSNSSNALENLIDTDGPVTAISEDDLPTDLRDWEVPEELRKKFPLYLSGYDFEDRPIWVAEMGKMDLHSWLERGPEAEKDLEKYTAYAARLMIDSNSAKDPAGYAGNFIVDLDGMSFKHFAQFRSVAFLMKIGYRYRKILADRADYVAIINANYAAQAAANAARPLIGRVMEVVEIFGTDKSKWQPQLLRHFPRESIPEWYGGYKNFTPVRVI